MTWFCELPSSSWDLFELFLKNILFKSYMKAIFLVLWYEDPVIRDFLSFLLMNWSGAWTWSIKYVSSTDYSKKYISFIYYSCLFFWESIVFLYFKCIIAHIVKIHESMFKVVNHICLHVCDRTALKITRNNYSLVSQDYF